MKTFTRMQHFELKHIKKEKVNRNLLLFISILFSACTSSTNEKGKEAGLYWDVRQDFQEILDSAKLTGIILIYDTNDSVYRANSFDTWQYGSLPASTFKIPNTIIGLETGILKDTNDVFKWDGRKRNMPQWEQDLTLASAYRYSCVPCYQELARAVGTKRMVDKLALLKFGEMQVSDTNIDKFWLQGSSQISPYQQIDFLVRLNTKQLPISKATYMIMKDVMRLPQFPADSVYGKTGWVLRENQNIGWFVGYVLKNGRSYYFATRIEPKPGFDMKNFPKTRIDITEKALKILHLLE